MAIMVWPINNVTYDGDDVRGGYAPRGSGVYAMDTHFPVSVSGNQVTIGTGSAWMQLDKLKGLTFQIESPETVSLPALTGTQVARVFLHAEVNTPGNNAVVVRTGASSTDSTINPVQNTSVFELAPYEFIYQGGSYVLIDNRGNERLCGLMRDEITKLAGTQQIVDEARALISNLTLETEKLKQIINDIEGGNPYMLRSAYDLGDVVNNAGGIVSYYTAHESYSYTEIQTGANWVDGKFIYRKVVNIGSMPNSESKTVAHGIQNLDNVVSAYGIVKRSTDNITVTLPYVESSPTVNANTGMGIAIDPVNITVTSGVARSYFSGFAVIEYTKIS